MWQPLTDWVSKQPDLSAADGNALYEIVERIVHAERLRCAKIIDTKFQEARDTEFDFGFETARTVFAAAILNPNN